MGLAGHGLTCGAIGCVIACASLGVGKERSWTCVLRLRLIECLRSERGRSVVGPVLAIVGEQRPGDARVAVGHGHGGDVGVAALEQLAQPGAVAMATVLRREDGRAGTVDQQRAQVDLSLIHI